MSEMAVLHNFSEREQKESEGKWKARKEGVCYLYLRRRGLAPACFCSYSISTSKLAERVQRSEQKFLFFKKYMGAGVKQTCSHREIEPLGWTLSKEHERADTQTYTPSLPGRAYTCRQTVKRKGMWGALLPVEYQLPVRGKRVKSWLFCCWTFLQPPAAVVFFHTIHCACVGNMSR